MYVYIQHFSLSVFGPVFLFFQIDQLNLQHRHSITHNIPYPSRTSSASSIHSNYSKSTTSNEYYFNQSLQSADSNLWFCGTFVLFFFYLLLSIQSRSIDLAFNTCITAIEHFFMWIRLPLTTTQPILKIVVYTQFSVSFAFISFFMERKCAEDNGPYTFYRIGIVLVCFFD